MAKPRTAYSRRIPTAEDRRATIVAAGGCCSHCGETNVPLEIRFIVPRSEGGGVGRDNLEAVCPNCHRLLDSAPSEIFFSRFLADFLLTNPDYAEIISEPVLENRRLRPDILATEVREERTRELLIECKSFPVLSDARVENIRKQLLAYRELLPSANSYWRFRGERHERCVKR